VSSAQGSLLRQRGPAFATALLLLAGLALARLAREAPLVRAGGLIHADALSALVLVVAAGHGLVGYALGAGRPWRSAAACVLVALAALMGHLAAAGALLIGVAALQPAPAMASLWARALRWLPAGCAALGLALIGLIGGEWRHGLPGAGAGLNSASLALILLGALLAVGATGLVRARAPEESPLVALGCLYALLRLFSLGPWNLGWLFAALLAGGGVALWAAWSAAAAPPAEVAPWLGLYLGGLVVAGAGLASGAGITLAGYALLLGPLLRLGLSNPQPQRALWPLSAAVPLSAPFVAAWMGVAAAAAGGVTVLAVALWAAALLAALPPARLAASAPPAVDGERGPATVAALTAAGLSAALGLGAPLVVLGLLQPLVAQLQAGLTPFGAIELWSWAGLIALDAARQPVATIPSLALAALMVILSALCWVALRLGALKR